MARDLRLWLSMKLSQNRYAFGTIVFVRTILLTLKMRPRRWRSWRHDRLVLGVGYFTLSYSKLEQEFVEQACLLATARGHAYMGLDTKAEHESYRQASSISGSDFKKAATWAKQARQMTNDPELLHEIDMIVSETAVLSNYRQTIIHNFGFLGEQHDIIWPAQYVQAYQLVKADWGEEYREFKIKIPVIHRYTYSKLKQLDAQTMRLIGRLDDLRLCLVKDFYRFVREEKS